MYVIPKHKLEKFKKLEEASVTQRADELTSSDHTRDDNGKCISISQLNSSIIQPGAKQYIRNTDNRIKAGKDDENGYLDIDDDLGYVESHAKGTIPVARDETITGKSINDIDTQIQPTSVDIATQHRPHMVSTETQVQPTIVDAQTQHRQRMTNTGTQAQPDGINAETQHRQHMSTAGTQVQPDGINAETQHQQHTTSVETQSEPYSVLATTTTHNNPENLPSIPPTLIESATLNTTGNNDVPVLKWKPDQNRDKNLKIIRQKLEKIRKKTVSHLKKKKQIVTNGDDGTRDETRKITTVAEATASEQEADKRAKEPTSRELIIEKPITRERNKKRKASEEVGKLPKKKEPKKTLAVQYADDDNVNRIVDTVQGKNKRKADENADQISDAKRKKTKRNPIFLSNDENIWKKIPVVSLRRIDD